MKRSMMYEDFTHTGRLYERAAEQERFREEGSRRTIERLRNFIPYDDIEKIANLKQIKFKIYSKNISDIFDGTVEFRTLLSTENSPPIQAVIDSGVVPRFVELLSKKTPIYNNLEPNMIKRIRNEAAWVLTNIASGSSAQTKIIIDFGAAPLLIELLNENDEECVDQAIWALGNISGDSEGMRDMVIYSGGTDKIVSIGLKLIDDSRYIKILRNLTWLLSNLNRGLNPPAPYESIEKSLHLIEPLINLNDSHIIIDSFYTICYICESTPNAVNLILNSPILNRFNILLKNITVDMFAKNAAIPLIRLVNIISSTSVDYCDFIINNEYIFILKNIFENLQEGRTQTKIRREILLTFNTIASYEDNHANYLYKINVIKILCSVMETESIVRQEACIVLYEIIKHKNLTAQYINMYMETELLVLLNCNLDFFSHIPSVQLNLLDAIIILIECSGNNNIYLINRMKDFKITNTLNMLNNSDEYEIRDRASMLLNTYFQ